MDENRLREIRKLSREMQLATLEEMMGDLRCEIKDKEYELKALNADYLRLKGV